MDSRSIKYLRRKIAFHPTIDGILLEIKVLLAHLIKGNIKISAGNLNQDLRTKSQKECPQARRRRTQQMGFRRRSTIG